MNLLLNLTLIIVTFVMGSVFLVMPVPAGPVLKNYKTSLIILAGAYFSMALLNSYIVYVDPSNDTPDYFNFIDLLISSIQALLFTFTMITLINPGFVTRRRLIKTLFPIVVFVLVYILLLINFRDKQLLMITDFGEWIFYPNSVIRILFFIFFIGQLGYLSYLFFKEEKKYLKHLKDFFSNPLRLHLKWFRYAFFSSLTIGLMSLTIQIFPYKELDMIFNISVTVFYFVFAINYLKYNKLFAIIEPVLQPVTVDDINKVKNNRSRMIWDSYREVVIAEKAYLKEGVTLDELAQMLKIGRTTLSTLINSEEKMNFNSWINQLRIEEAKILLVENPTYSIIRIAEMSGFSEHSNFSRQFKLITGKTPSAWRNNQEIYRQN